MTLGGGGGCAPVHSLPWPPEALEPSRGSQHTFGCWGHGGKRLDQHRAEAPQKLPRDYVAAGPEEVQQEVTEKEWVLGYVHTVSKSRPQKTKSQKWEICLALCPLRGRQSQGRTQSPRHRPSRRQLFPTSPGHGPSK